MASIVKPKRFRAAADAADAAPPAKSAKKSSAKTGPLLSFMIQQKASAEKDASFVIANANATPQGILYLGGVAMEDDRDPSYGTCECVRLNGMVFGTRCGLGDVLNDINFKCLRCGNFTWASSTLRKTL